MFKALFFSLVMGSIPSFSGIEDHLITSQDILIGKHLKLEGWSEDFKEAQKKACEKGIPILIAFLGPNWCAWSDKLEEDVLSDPTFLKILKQEVVLLRVEIPEDFEVQTENSYPNLQLKEKYQVSECPSLVLIESTGEEIGKMEYLPLEGKEFGCYVKEMLADFHQMQGLLKQNKLRSLSLDQLKTLYVKAGKFADATFKKSVLAQGLKVDRGPYFLLEQYGQLLAKGEQKHREAAKIRNAIVTRDPQNAQGSQRRLAVMDFEALAGIAKKGERPEKAIQPIVEYLNQFGKQDTENNWRLEMMISRYLFGKDQIEEALNHAQTSLTLAPDTAKSEIVQSIEYLQTRLSK